MGADQAESDRHDATQPTGERRVSRSWRLARGTYLLVCNTLLVLIGAEVAWRATSRWRLDERELRQLEKPPEERVGITLHPFFQSAHPPTAKTDPGPNAYGWRVDPRDAVEDFSRKRILFLGGSTTESGYPSLVRTELEPALGPVTVFNTGISWHCSLHSLYKVWTYLDRWKPDLVVVLHAINDFYRGFTPPPYALPSYHPDYSHFSGALSSYWTIGHARGDGRPVFYARPLESVTDAFERPDPSVGAWLGSLAMESELLRSLREWRRGGARIGRPSTGDANDRVVDMPESVYLRALPDFVLNMRAIRDSCELKGVPVLFLTMPFTVDVDTKTFEYPAALFTNDGVEHLAEAQFIDGMKRFNAAALELGDDHGAWTLDLASQIVDPKLFGDEVHLEPDGLELEAKLVAAKIVEIGVLGGH